MLLQHICKCRSVGTALPAEAEASQRGLIMGDVRHSYEPCRRDRVKLDTNKETLTYLLAKHHD